MGPLVATSSVLVAFVGGVLALAAPCCVTYLLPAYLASVYRAQRAVLAMTFVFAAGIAVVLMPMVLGVAALADLLGSFHTEVFIVGGVFLLFLGFWSLAGRNIALPMRPTPNGNYSVPSVFGLGVFSGAASSCCAPVLAGVLTLSAVSSSLPQALMIGSAYILGMVAPLMVLAYFWDRLQLANHAIVRGRHLTLRLGPIHTELHSTNLIAGVMFLAMGSLIIVLAFTGEAGTASDAQVRFSAELTRIADRVVSIVGGAPDFVFALLLFGGTVVLFIKAFPAVGRPIGRVAAAIARPAATAHRSWRARDLTQASDRGDATAPAPEFEEVHHG
ncbi:MAG: cytochrome c biogenesis protein CcdA [Dehalococcoidia bacterium]|nr:MAG: cytochrome c biogenesis protein CcdA [Dehalococcoidia bacterium]